MDQELDSVRRNIHTVHQKEPFLGLSILCPSFLFCPFAGLWLQQLLDTHRKTALSLGAQASQAIRRKAGVSSLRRQGRGWGCGGLEGACLDENSGNAALLNTMLAGGHPGLCSRAGGHAGQGGERAAGDRRLSGAHRIPW